MPEESPQTGTQGFDKFGSFASHDDWISDTLQLQAEPQDAIDDVAFGGNQRPNGFPLLANFLKYDFGLLGMISRGEFRLTGGGQGCANTLKEKAKRAPGTVEGEVHPVGG